MIIPTNREETEEIFNELENNVMEIIKYGVGEDMLEKLHIKIVGIRNDLGFPRRRIDEKRNN